MKTSRSWLLATYFYERETGQVYAHETGEEVNIRDDKYGIPKIKCGMFWYPAYYVVYFMATGKKPDLVFVKDGNKRNLKFDNLLPMSIAEAFRAGRFTAPKDCQCDMSGCTWKCIGIGSNKWQAQDQYQAFAMFEYNKFTIGYYNSQEKAKQAYLNFVRKYSVYNKKSN